MDSPSDTSRIEKFATGIDGLRLWITKTWKIGLLMAKGAYLLGERKVLFQQLGEEVYYRFLKGEWHDPDLEERIRQIERLSKKVEIEEMLILSQRYGDGLKRPQRSTTEPIKVD